MAPPTGSLPPSFNVEDAQKKVNSAPNQQVSAPTAEGLRTLNTIEA